MKYLKLYLVLMLLALTVLGEVSCPFGKVNEPYPGTCWRYVDKNDNALCDLSEVTTTSTTQKVVPEDDHNLAKSLVKPTAPLDETTILKIENKPSIPRYNFTPLTIFLLITYFFSFTLERKKTISPFTHRMLWNLLLAFSFIITAISGILLVIRINTGWDPHLPLNMLYWHVEAGVVMTVVTIFHIIWHWPYYKAIVCRIIKK